MIAMRIETVIRISYDSLCQLPLSLVSMVLIPIFCQKH